MIHLRTFAESATTEPGKIVWIHGLPGSGKTTLAARIMRESRLTMRHLDDTKSYTEVVELLKLGCSVVLSSAYFESYGGPALDWLLSKALRANGITPVEIWFENNPDACIKNVSGRKGHHIDNITVMSEIRNYSNRYEVPPDAKVIPVWDPTADPAVIDEAVAWVLEKTDD
jgi:gluconate kinase